MAPGAVDLLQQRSRQSSMPRSVGQARGCGVRRLLSEDHNLGQVIERLERTSRAMNPLLLYIAMSLVVLNLMCVCSLIDWRHLPQTPPDPPAASSEASASVK